MVRWIVFVLAMSSLGLAQLCDQPFSPVRANWEWQYRVTGENPTTYSVRRTNITDSGFMAVQQNAQGRGETKFRCTLEGLTPIDFGGRGPTQAGVGGGGVDLDITVKSVRGVQIPDLDKWAVGERWGYTLELGGTAQQGPVRFNVEGTVESLYRVVAQEAVTVPAGRFQALKVQVTTNFKIVGRAGPLSIPFNQSGESTAWYVEGVGMVKTVSRNNTTELVALRKG